MTWSFSYNSFVKFHGKGNYRKMTIKWSFSYNSFVKFHGKKVWEPQHEGLIYIKISVIAKCVIKGIHCTVHQQEKIWH